MYIPLHVHTALGSIGDSILKLDDYIERGKALGLKKLAITDHGSLSAMYAFARKCKMAGIKPIIGMEAYEVEEAEKQEKYKYNHLVLLAKNKEGLENLIRIHNDAQTRGYYYKPRTDRSALQKWGKGIIALSACVAGSIPQAVLERNLHKAVNLINFYKNCFDEFFLEIQPGKFRSQVDVNNGIVYLAHYTKTPVVVTNDIHYLNEEDYKTHDYHIKLSRKGKDLLSEELIYPDICYWFMQEDDILNSFTYTKYVKESTVERGIRNAMYIAQQCNVELDISLQMPEFYIKKEEEIRALEQKCWTALNELIGRGDAYARPQKYIDRLRYELSIIKEKGFCGYFLIVQDYMNWARKNGLNISYARGSAAGSLVAYLLQITAPDPLKYNLLFERFLDPKREALCDIDIDISGKDRDKLFDYITQRYGINNCTQISAVHVRKARGAIKDAARVLGLSVDLADTVSKTIPQVATDDAGEKVKDLSIEASLRVSPDLRKYRDEYPLLFELAQKLEGLPSSSGIHAAGVIISPQILTDKIPLIKTKNNSKLLATSLTLEDTESMLVKFDILALDTSDILEKTKQDVGITFDSQDVLKYKDPKVFDLIGARWTAGLFQIGSNLYKQRLCKIKPKNIQQLSDCLALIRGPSITAKKDEEYIAVLKGWKKPRKIHPIYDEITKRTKGILIYQEQIMQLCKAIGIDMSIGYRLIKAGAKKKREEIEMYKSLFIIHCLTHRITTSIARELFHMIELSSYYSFNLGHSVSYALTCYQSAYLKWYYFVPFMKNLLNNRFIGGKQEETKAAIKECIDCELKLLQPDINQSGYECSIENKNQIRLGLCAIKGLGEAAVIELLRAREEVGGAFESFDQFIKTVEKKKFNRNKIIVCIFAGVFDSFGFTKRQLYETYCISYLGEEPQDIVSISRGFTIKTKSKAVKGMQAQFFTHALS